MPYVGMGALLPGWAGRKKFRPSQLFATGAQGVWYDPPDLSSELQDSAGTTLVTAVEQPVGLRLDKRLGLVRGAEMCANGGFADATGFTLVQPTAGAVTISGGQLRINTTDGSSCWAQYTAAPLTVGKTYEITLDVVAVAAGGVRIDAGGVVGTSKNSTGQLRTIVTATTTSAPQVTRGGGVCDVTVDNLSYRELPGNHASQATSTSRPKLSARVNLLRGTTALTGGLWATNGTPTVTDNFATTPGGSPATRIAGATSGWGKYQSSDLTIPAGPVRLRLVLKDNGGTDKDAYIGLGQNSFGGTGGDRSFLFNTVTGVFTNVNAVYSSTAARSLGSGWWEVLATALTTTSATPTVAIYTDTGSDYLAGEPDLRSAGDAALAIPAYQRVNTATDYDTAGFMLGNDWDGVDDSLSASAGGGASAGFFFCGAIRVGGGAGALRCLWSDRSGNTGYEVRLNASNRIELNAGNAAARTFLNGDVINVGETRVVTAWDDGVNLNVQVNNAPIVSTARPAVSAGTAGFTIGKDNGAATNFFPGRDYGMVALGRAPTSAEITRTQRWLAARAGVAL